jgi:hypothetical protein
MAPSRRCQRSPQDKGEIGASAAWREAALDEAGLVGQPRPIPKKPPHVSHAEAMRVPLLLRRLQLLEPEHVDHGSRDPPLVAPCPPWQLVVVVIVVVMIMVVIMVVMVVLVVIG